MGLDFEQRTWVEEIMERLIVSRHMLTIVRLTSPDGRMFAQKHTEYSFNVYFDMCKIRHQVNLFTTLELFEQYLNQAENVEEDEDGEDYSQ